jgi:FkbM family methyltransferase
MTEEYVTEGVAEYVMSLFPDTFRGVCIDVGAFHPTWISNSWIFEQKGWDVYCIEPNPHCIPLLKSIRKHVIEFACGEKILDDVDFYIYKTPWAGLNTEKTEFWEGEAADTGLIKHEKTVGILEEIVKVNVRTLDFILGHYYLPFQQIDYLSIDVEKNEMSVLRGLDLTRWRPKIIVIENEFMTADQHGWLSSYGYWNIKRIGPNDIYAEVHK